MPPRLWQLDGVAFVEVAPRARTRPSASGGSAAPDSTRPRLSRRRPITALPNVIISPHMASGRDRRGEHIVDFWCDNIRRFADGRPLRGVVERFAGY